MDGLFVSLSVERQALSGLADFGHEQVFEQATTYTCLLFLSGSESATFEYARIKPSSQMVALQPDFRELPSSSLAGEPWLMATGEQASIAGKLEVHAVELLGVPAMMSRGSSSGDDSVFILQRTAEHGKYLAANGETLELEEEALRIPLFATDFNRYRFSPKMDKMIVFPYRRGQDGSIQLMPETLLKSEYPEVYRYLCSHRKQLEQRKQYKAWYGFSAPRNLEVHDAAQLVVPLLADKGLYAELPSDRARYCLMASGGFSITVDDKSGLSPRYVLGLLNSKLLFWQLRSISNMFRGGWITCTKQYVGTLPIRTIDFTSPANVARHDRMVALVERMLDLHKKLAAEGAPHVVTVLQRQIEATDREIDRLVYELYGLTDEEIAVVEG